MVGGGTTDEDKTGGTELIDEGGCKVDRVVEEGTGGVVGGATVVVVGGLGLELTGGLVVAAVVVVGGSTTWA